MLNRLIGSMLGCMGLLFFLLVVLPIIAARTGGVGYCLGLFLGLAILGKIFFRE